MRPTPEGVGMKWRAGGWETAIRVYSRHCRKQVPNGFVKLDPTHGCGMLLRTGGPREADFCWLELVGFWSNFSLPLTPPLRNVSWPNDDIRSKAFKH